MGKVRLPQALRRGNAEFHFKEQMTKSIEFRGRIGIGISKQSENWISKHKIGRKCEAALIDLSGASVITAGKIASEFKLTDSPNNRH